MRFARILRQANRDPEGRQGPSRARKGPAGPREVSGALKGLEAARRALLAAAQALLATPSERTRESYRLAFNHASATAGRYERMTRPAGLEDLE